MMEISEKNKKKQIIKAQQIIEAFLFSSQKSLTIGKLSEFTGFSKDEITKSIQKLKKFYERNDRAFGIYEVAGGYQLRTHALFQKWIRKNDRQRDAQLSPTIIETLSIIAYKQPVTRAEIESIRTVDSSYSIRLLLDRRLIRILGKKEIVGRPLLYGTSRNFLEVFGFKSLSDLPDPEDFDLQLNN